MTKRNSRTPKVNTKHCNYLILLNNQDTTLWYFLEAYIDHDDPPETSGADGLAVVRLLTTCEKSLADNSALTLLD